MPYKKNENGCLIWEHAALCSIKEIKEIKFIHVKKEVMIKNDFSIST